MTLEYVLHMQIKGAACGRTLYLLGLLCAYFEGGVLEVSEEVLGVVLELGLVLVVESVLLVVFLW